jgi:putative tricarboxylic transport membrane protein
MVGAFFIVESQKLSSSAYGSRVGPELFPMGLGILLILLSILLIYKTFRYSKEEKKVTPVDVKRFLIIFIATLLYALLLELMGYVLSTFIFLTVAFQTMEKGKLWLSILISGAFSLGVYYLYVEVLKGTLPAFPF